MTDKEVRKLKRTELLEILFYLEKELEELKQENEELRQRLNGGVLPEVDLERIAEAVARRLDGETAHTDDADETAPAEPDVRTDTEPEASAEE